MNNHVTTRISLSLSFDWQVMGGEYRNMISRGLLTMTNLKNVKPLWLGMVVVLHDFQQIAFFSYIARLI